MSEHLDGRPIISFRNALIVGIIIVFSYPTISILLSDYTDLRNAVTNILAIITDLLSALCLIYAAYNSRYNNRIQISWVLLAISRLFYTAGDIIYAYFESVLHQQPFPSIADPAFLAFYPIFALGILMLPKVPMTSSEKQKFFLDVGIVTIASAIVFWIFLIAPTIESQAQEEVVTSILSVAYPVADLVLLFALIETLFRRFESAIMRPVLFLIAGMSLMILSDVLYMDQSLKYGSLTEGTMLFGGLWQTSYYIAYVFIGLAGITQANLKNSDNSSFDIITNPMKFKWATYLPQFCVLSSFFFLIWGYDHLPPISFSALSWAVGGIIGMVVIRQVVALNENVRLYQDKVQEINQRIRAEEEVRKLNATLENRVTERTEELEVANKELKKEIQEHKISDEALRDSQQLMSNMINFLPDALIALDLDGKIIIWNKAIETLTKVRSEDMLGKSNYEHSIPFYGYRKPILIDMILEPHEGFEAEYLGFQRDGDAVVGEAFIPTFSPHGSYLLGKATKLYNASGKVIGVIESIRDMTDRRIMEQKLERTKTELRISADIQRRFIPEHTPVVPRFDIAAVTIPAMEVGGDFYDFIQLPDNRYGIVIADVAGKSIPAAIFMALSRTIIRANIANQKKISNVLASANKMIESDATQGMFVTLLYGVIDEDGLAFRYSNAGHYPPLIFRSANCTFEKEDVTGIALGVIRDANYLENIILISPGDIIALYTDGVTEAMNNNGEMYGEERLLDVISSHCQENAKDIVDQVLENIKSFTEKKEQQDDLTLVILKATGQVQKGRKIRVPAHENEVPGIIGSIEESMRCLGFSDEDNLSFQLAVEEACINIMNHGYRNAKGYISIVLESRPNCFTVIIEDEAPQFDPIRFEKPKLAEDLNEMPIGGFGIHLVKSLTDEMIYDYVEGKNRLTLIKKMFHS